MTNIAVCRLCVSCSNLSDIIDTDEHLREKIEYCYNIKIVPNDVSTKICSRCKEGVIQFNKLKLGITEADAFLRDISKLLRPGVKAYHVSKLFHRTFKTPGTDFNESRNIECVSQVECSINEDPSVKTETISLLNNDTVQHHIPIPQSTVTNQNPPVCSTPTKPIISRNANVMTVIPDDVKEELDLRYKKRFEVALLDKNASVQKEHDLVSQTNTEASTIISKESESDMVQDVDVIADYAHLSLEDKTSYISTKSIKEVSISSSPILPKVAKIIVKKNKDGKMSILKPKKHKLSKKRRLSHKLKRKRNSKHEGIIDTSITDSVRFSEDSFNLSEEDNINNSVLNFGKKIERFNTSVEVKNKNTSLNSSILLSATPATEELIATDVGNKKKLIEANSDLSSIDSENNGKNSFVPNVSFSPINTSLHKENIAANINNNESLLHTDVVSSSRGSEKQKSKSPTVNHSNLMNVDVMNEPDKCFGDDVMKRSMKDPQLTVNTNQIVSKELNLLPTENGILNKTSIELTKLDTHPVLNGALDKVQHANLLEGEDTSSQLFGTSCPSNTPFQVSVPAVENHVTAEHFVATGDSDSIRNVRSENVKRLDINISGEPYVKLSSVIYNDTSVINNDLEYPESSTSSLEVFSDPPTLSAIGKDDIYFCNFCPEHFTSRQDLLKHLTKFHRFVCQHCRLRFNKRRQLLKHNFKFKCSNNKNDWKVKTTCNVTLLNVCDIQNLKIKRNNFKGTLKKDLMQSLKYLRKYRSDIDLRPARNIYYGVPDSPKPSLKRALSVSHLNSTTTGPQGKVTGTTEIKITDSIENSSKEDILSIIAASKKRRRSLSKNEINNENVPTTSASNSETNIGTKAQFSSRRRSLANKSKKSFDDESLSTSDATDTKSKKTNITEKNNEISLIKSC